MFASRTEPYELWRGPSNISLETSGRPMLVIARSQLSTGPYPIKCQFCQFLRGLSALLVGMMTIGEPWDPNLEWYSVLEVSDALEDSERGAWAMGVLNKVGIGWRG